MSDLRIILLIVGALFIIGIYCWEVFFKSEPKRKDNILDAIDDIPDLPSMGVKQDDPADYSRSLIDLGNMIAQSRSDTNLSQEDTPIFRAKTPEEPQAEPVTFDKKTPAEDTAVIPHAEESLEDDDATFSDVDFDLFAGAEKPDDSKQLNDATVEQVDEEKSGTREDAVTEKTVETESDQDDDDDDDYEEDDDAGDADTQLGQDSEDIIVLYVTSPAQTLFNGLSISKAADEVGMVYGHMNVFHHFGPGKLHSGQPLFSMANMYEPGSFDLGRMADMKTKGVVLFMYSPASIEPRVVFELFLNTAQRVAELLNGELRTQDNRLLSSIGIESLRLKADSLSSLQ